MLASLAGLLVLTAAMAAAATAEVLARGQLLPWGGTGVRRVRVWGLIELYVSSETSAPSPDLVTTLLLVALASVCAFGAVVLREVPRSARFLAVAAAGAGYLAADELLAVHETVGHNLGWLARLPLVERPDDVIFGLYAVPAALFLWCFRDLIAAVPLSRLLLWTGLAAYVAAAGLDVLGTGGRIENAVEILATAFLLAAFVGLAARLVGEQPRVGGASPQPVADTEPTPGRELSLS